jgi:putative sterol carrier protein
MIKSKNKSEIIIDLTGSDGNAFVLIGKAGSLAKQLGLDKDAIQKEMMGGNYDNLIKVFDKHFGHFVTLLK